MDLLFNKEGTEIESLTCSYKLSQPISDPTHNLQNSFSCTDFAFTNQPNFINDSGMHPSLHPNCHQKIVFSKLKLKCEYPPYHDRLVRDYKNADSQSINEAIEIFNWEKLFQNKNIHDEIKLFIEAIVNSYNGIPNQCTTCH